MSKLANLNKIKSYIWIDYQNQSTEPEILDIELAKRILNEASNISIKPIPNYRIGVDGTTFELEFRAGFNLVKYRWWCDLPDNWRVFLPLIDILNNYIETKRT
ncbi:MAG: hypothetical protein WBM44_29085 [Waterburya sp.]